MWSCEKGDIKTFLTKLHMYVIGMDSMSSYIGSGIVCRPFVWLHPPYFVLYGSFTSIMINTFIIVV